MKDDFDYKGYSEEELYFLTDDLNVCQGKVQWKYWSAETYGFGRGYRNYGFFPSFLPLCIWSDHGISYGGRFHDYDINTDAPCMFVTNMKTKNEYKKVSTTPCYVVSEALIAYRRIKRINQVDNPKGTLIFPAHSCSITRNCFSREELIEKIKTLPEKFHPVCVMLHMWDIRHGDHKVYMDNDIPVYTAGNGCDYRYGDRFYGVLKNFEYSMTNSMGTFMFYCIEMGIPCSMISEKAEDFYFESREQKKKGEKYFLESSISKKADDLLRRSKPDEISDEMRDFVNEHAGLNDGISRFKMATLLYSAYFKKGNLIKDLASFFQKAFYRRIHKLREKYIRKKYAKYPYKLEKKLRELDGISVININTPIVHVMFNDKFNKPFVDFLNKNFDQENHTIICKRWFQDLPFPKGKNVIEITSLQEVNLTSNKIQKIICHSLFDSQLIDFLHDYPAILKKKSYWLVWGGDLYDCIRDEKNDFVRKNFAGYLGDLDKEYICEQYEVNPDKFFEVFCCFPVSKTILDQTIKKDSCKTTIRVQVNNSCDKSTLEILDVLSKYAKEDMIVTTVVSYGNLEYKDEIISIGKKIFGDRFEYINEFLDSTRYSDYIASNDILILNQERQQGVGNTLAHLYLGNKVFIRSNVSVNKYLNNRKIKIYDTETIANMTFNDFIFNDSTGENRKNISKYLDEEYLKNSWESVFYEE